MNEIISTNAPQAYVDAIWKMHMWAQAEESRNGPVLTSREPVLLTILNPIERVIFDPVRNANPFFHLMEFVWMMSGSNDVRWIEQFNSRFREYADPGTNALHGAYGHRWRKHWRKPMDELGQTFKRDQILDVINLLKKDRTTRRAVLGMWDPNVDLEPHNDLPCNTHIYFRFVEGEGLNMTVCNRSNDLIWGMMGANVVHMTLLHELIARGAGVPMGKYQVFTNNLHIYKNMPNFESIWNTLVAHDPYKTQEVDPISILAGGETVELFLADCEEMVARGSGGSRCWWMNAVAEPAYEAYLDRKNKVGNVALSIDSIIAEDWRIACQEWIQRKES